MKARMGNFIDGPDVFDNKFFRISPREARSLDPQQRILLHTTYEALEDAGYVPDATDTWKRETFGCYVGAATGDYTQNLKNDVDVYYATGEFCPSAIIRCGILANLVHDLSRDVESVLKRTDIVCYGLRRAVNRRGYR